MLRPVVSGRRLAAVAASLAVATTGALVVAPHAEARAGSASNTYTCAVPGLGDVSVPTTFGAPALGGLSTFTAGVTVPAGLLGPTLNLVIPPSLATALTTLSVDGVTSPDFAMQVVGETASTTVGLTDVALLSSTVQGDGNTLLATKGKNAAFTTPQPGLYSITMPAAFSVIASSAGLDLATITCTLPEGTDPGLFSTITFTKQTSSITPNPTKLAVKAGKRGKIAVSVVNQAKNATGTVIAKEGSKKVGQTALTNGAGTVTLAKLARGKHKITLVYGGDTYTEPATSAPVVVTVK